MEGLAVHIVPRVEHQRQRRNCLLGFSREQFDAEATICGDIHANSSNARYFWSTEAQVGRASSASLAAIRHAGWQNRRDGDQPR
jgi:hypothetical protein